MEGFLDKGLDGGAWEVSFAPSCFGSGSPSMLEVSSRASRSA